MPNITSPTEALRKLEQARAVYGLDIDHYVLGILASRYPDDLADAVDVASHLWESAVKR